MAVKKCSKRTHNPPKLTLQAVDGLIQGRGIVRERAFAPTSKFQFYNQASRQFSQLMKPRSKGNLTFVHMYYTQICFSGGITAKFRDHSISITTEKIHRLYQLPKVAKKNCRFAKLIQDEEHFPYEEISKTVSIDGENIWYCPKKGKKYLNRGDLNPEARCWLHLVKRNICPGAHATQITKEIALLVYLLMIQQPVRLEDIIFDAIQKCSTSHNRNLIFPHLISDLCVQAGIPQSVDDEKFDPDPPFEYNNVCSHRDPETRKRIRERTATKTSSNTKRIIQLQREVTKLRCHVTSELREIKALLNQLLNSQDVSMHMATPSDPNHSVHAKKDAARATDANVSMEGTDNTKSTEELSSDNDMSEDTSMGDTGNGTNAVDEASGSEFDPDDED